MQDLFIVFLCVAPLSARLLWTRGRTNDAAAYGSVGLALAFCFFALGHVVLTQELARMLPPWVPGRVPIVYVTGVIEVIIAVALFRPSWRRYGGWAAAVVLVLFFPANIYAAINHLDPDKPEMGAAYLWIRTPLQLFLLAWTLWPIRTSSPAPTPGPPAFRPSSPESPRQ